MTDYRYEVFSWRSLEGFYIRYKGDSWIKSWYIFLKYRLMFSGGTRRVDFKYKQGYWD
ncbi:hypothetical protein VPHG_00188 [Vibrio phage 11895-B1]|uniref:hypothetical protein n=1 Tax=Vibrio phage 11895-B1 TaxID=754075 RepID=UPI0002C106FE|nr:hypothetical protein VPHG_00188 [Vibrio phage 11895-B1]AGH32251.1 hypothetical protein VPHG_00188 [Vibrio phage 11895-B1]